MPFVNNMNDEEEQKKGAPNGVSPEGSGGGSVRLAPDAGVEAGAGSTGTGGRPDSAGGQFASLNKYLDANTGRAEPLAGKLTAKIGEQYQGLDAAGQQAISKIGGQVSASKSYADANKTISEATADPVSFTTNPNRTAGFQDLLRASYTGPLSAESTNEFAGQQTAINDAIAKGQNTVQTEAGRSTLIKEASAKPTTGVAALNSAILSQSPEALASVENAYKPFSNLMTNLQTGAADTNKTIAQRQDEAAGAKKASSEALTSGMSGLNKSIQDKVAAAQKNLTDQNTMVKGDIGAGNASDATLAALGLTREKWNALSDAKKAAATSSSVQSNKAQFGANTGTADINLGEFLKQIDPNTINAGNAASADDYARAQAFQSLLGNLNLQAPELLINPNAKDQAGTAPTKGNAFDYDTALSTAKQADMDQIASAQAYVDALQSGADEEHAQLAAAKASQNRKVAGMSAIAQTPLAATGAVVSGAPAAAQTYAQKLTSSNPAQIAANVATMGLAPVAQGVAAGVQKAVKTVTQIFCFHPDTLVTMADGSLLPIHKIVVGDMTKGGKVLATTRAIGQDFYWYNGVVVTGKHAVRENGAWIRVEETKVGHKINLLMEVVCSLVTEKHRIYAHGIEFADQYETDLYESLDMTESLAELNRNA